MKTWRKLIGSPVGKGVSLLLMGSLLTDILSPTLALALTGGPSQPEFQGFTEVGVTNMVDAFTGDFNYEIPLMTVPGPNGGYPINLTYMAGAGMEDEAGWVGLGWSLNPGAINRNMRGLPDDFSGPQEENGNTLVSEDQADKVGKSFFTKNNVTVGAGLGFTFSMPEVAGADLSFDENSPISFTPNANLYYNTYKGLGFRAGIGMKLSTVSNEGGSGGLGANLNLNFDSNDGASVQPSISLSSGIGQGKASISYGFGYTSREGVTNTFLNTSYTRQFRMKKKGSDKVGKKNISSGNGVSFASTTGVPATTVPMFGVNAGFNLDFEAGAFMTHMNVPISFDGMFSVQQVKDWMQYGYGYPAYGTLYSGYRQNNGDIEKDRALMDYNRENDWPINMKSPMLPMPVMTHDVYTVTGAQVGGSFRAFRNDVGVFYEPRVASDFLGVTIGVEVAAAPGFKVGVDPTVNFTHSYSGKWKVEEDIQNVTETNFFRKRGELMQGGIRTVEPFDFRFTDETTALYADDARFSKLGGNGAGHYTLFPATADFPDLSETEFEDPDAQTQMNTFFPFKDLGKFKPKASNKMNGQSIQATQTVRKHDTRKIQLVQYRTKKEVLDETAAGGEPLPRVLIDQNYITGLMEVMPDKEPIDLAGDPAIKGHHLAEFSIVQPGGMRYVYGFPLYNRVQNEFYFALKNNHAVDGKLVEVDNLFTLLNQHRGDGNDKLFTSSSIGPYAHAHLLTQIVSPDYIDVDHNGPSDADYGYWTKFNYYKPLTYKWRTPIKKYYANYIKGFESNPNDGKGTITYGERDMTYLHSIETKTHVAVFFTSARDDAHEAQGVEGGIDGQSQKMQKLDAIRLYSKNDLEHPIKTVRFVYTYELCEYPADNVGDRENRYPLESPFTYTDPETGQTVTEPYRGKLTLKKIFFTYGDSEKGTLTPYVFEYGKVYKDAATGVGLEENTALDGNPDYKTMGVDRWGMYKEEIPGGFTNEDVPYVDQAADAAGKRQASATAWNLTGIALPTGSKIKIAYEMDDYAYVQDRPATQLYQIAGMGKNGLQNPGSDIDWLDQDGAEITRDYDKVLFKLDDPNTTTAQFARMVQEIPDGKLYFKTWQRLQIPKGLTDISWASDYVTGYAPIETNSGFGIYEASPTEKYGYVTLKPVTEDNKNWNFFRKAGIQYLRYQRADLGMPQNQGDAALEAIVMITTAIPIIVQAIEMMSGYYNWALAKKHCKFIMPGKPSFVKLGTGDGIKYGGGHRVRKITISDAWNKLAGANDAEYGLEYFYHTTTADGRKYSSGVASYEPLIGGEENPMKKPHYYGPDNKFVHNDPAFYLEEPIGESYFPAPVVGYSKVVTVNLANQKNIKTGDGVQMKEFYTAKDFPIKASYTAQPQRIEDKQTVFIPLMASITLKGYGYAQGYYIELNDMHGKPKSESVHDADYWDVATRNWADPTGDLPYVSKKIYRYKANGNTLDNTVDVLMGDRMVENVVMGESSEMFSEMKEDFSYGFSAGAQVNGGVDPVPYGLFFSLFPNFSYDENSARVLVTTKVVYKNGILDEVVEMSEGAVKKTKNLLYDPETGQPLLTAVTSDYDNSQNDQNDQNIYNYTYPAYWYYSGMQAAYRNYRNAYLFGSGLAANNFPGADNYFEVGDELMSSAGKVWVNGVSSTSVSFIDSENQLVTNPTGVYVTVRSGKRNLQNVPSGALASLVNPATAEFHNALLDYYNNEISGSNCAACTTSICSANLNVGFDDVRDCADPSVYYGGTIRSYCNGINGSGPVILFEYTATDHPEVSCTIEIPVTGSFVPAKARLSYISPTKLRMTYEVAPGQYTQTVVTIVAKCGLTGCLDGILNASADEFSDKWAYDAEFAPAAGPFDDLNRFLRGEGGIWRKLRTNAYFSDRKQRRGGSSDDFKTYIGRDGTYDRFVVFDWLKQIDADPGSDGNKNNNQAPYGWRWQAEVTPYGYSPYGFEVENRNAMNIYSAELYGYGNSVVTASTQNAAYPEIAYDGFEEQPAGTYNLASSFRGHLAINNVSASVTLAISDKESHTGNQSLKVVSPSGGGWFSVVAPVIYPPASFARNTGKWEVNGSRKYVLGFWYRYDNPAHTGIRLGLKDISFIPNTNPVEVHNDFMNDPSVVLAATGPIEGWRRVETIIDMGPYIQSTGFSPTRITLDFYPEPGSTVYIDDLRLHPTDAPFKSYVYDPQRYLLRATLDDNNYASFYNYDEENTLVQVKKETEQGIRTIQTTRKNVQVRPH